MKDKGKTDVKVEKTLDSFPAWPRQKEGCGPRASVAWRIMSGRSSQRSLVLCRCEYLPLPGSPGSAQHNTSGICTRIWSFCWHGRCHSLSRSTSPHSCPCRGRFGYKPDPLSRGTLWRKHRKSQKVDFKGRKNKKIGTGDIICKVLDSSTSYHLGFNIKPGECLQ